MATTLPLTQLERELRQKVATSCRIIGNRNVTRGALGHVSARVPGTDRILIKAKGPDEEALEFAVERDVIVISINGEVLEAPDGLTAPNETAMHLAVFRRRPEVMSVIHSHPDWVVVLTGTSRPLVPMVGAYDGGASLRLITEGVPVYPRSLTIINDELGEDFMNTMGDHRACLLAGHGMTVAGASVEEATQTSLTVYELARLNYLAYAIGQPQAVSEQDRTEYLARRASGPYTPDRRRAGSSGEPAFWRYEKKRLPDLPKNGR
ncbi:MAG TPA: class II aldolase/adducin family protein [Chloroflexota bacterium]|nr:class II aldolase/adducin family protein [Chloroflexota bacterium]